MNERRIGGEGLAVESSYWVRPVEVGRFKDDSKEDLTENLESDHSSDAHGPEEDYNDTLCRWRTVEV